MHFLSLFLTSYLFYTAIIVRVIIVGWLEWDSVETSLAKQANEKPLGSSKGVVSLA